MRIGTSVCGAAREAGGDERRRFAEDRTTLVLLNNAGMGREAIEPRTLLDRLTARPNAIRGRATEAQSGSRVQSNRRSVQCEDLLIGDKRRFARDDPINKVASLFNAARD